MRTSFIAALCAALLLPGLVAAQDSDGQPNVAPDAATLDYAMDSVVARVGDSEITLGEMILLRQRLPQQYQSAPPEVLFEAVRRQLVDQQVLADSLSEPPAESVALALRNEERALLANQEMTNILAQAEISEEALQSAYDATYADYEPEPEFNASHILLETEEDALAVKAELDAGADFATVAQERSIGPSAPAGGQLGWFGRGAMIPVFEAAVSALEIGEVSDPFESEYGWHVAKLNDRRETAAPTLEEVRGDLTEQLRQQELQAEIETRREAAEVELPETNIPPAAILQDELLD